jgi:RND family efflux transporter MFP subunit
MKTHYLLLGFICIFAGCGTREEAPPKTIVNVTVVKPEITDVKIVIKAPASVSAREQANISSRVTAPIRKLLVRKGDTVATGQILAQLDNRDLVAQRDDALASVAEAEASLQQLTAGTLPTEIERARGQLANAEAARGQAQKIYDRRRQLFEQGGIPQRDLLVSQTELAQANTAYEVAKKSQELLQNQSHDKEILIAKSKVEQSQARLAFAKAQLSFTTIRSASAGTITEQFMFPGDMAKADAPLFTVMNLSIAVARAQVTENDAAGLRVGESCSFIPADGSDATFKGHISMVNQAVDPARRTIETWCDIPNPKHALRGGVYGQVQIVTGISPKSILIPVAAVQFLEAAKKGFVMVVGDKNIALKKDVETGETYEGKVQIKNGLTEKDLVIVQGAYELPEGTQIRLQEDKKP